MNNMQPPMSTKSADDFQTPTYAIDPLLPFILKDKIIWECASGNGNLVRAFENEGYKVVSSDISEGKDFLTYEPNNYDIIITNPPYSLKEEFLERAYNLGKPFAFLLPLTTLEGKFRQSLFKKYGIEILLLNKRINFETPSKKGGGSWFATAWFCWKLLPDKIMFGDLNTKKSFTASELLDSKIFGILKYVNEADGEYKSD